MSGYVSMYVVSDKVRVGGLSSSECVTTAFVSKRKEEENGVKCRE